MIATRRHFLSAGASFLAAPAIVRAENLMKVARLHTLPTVEREFGHYISLSQVRDILLPGLRVLTSDVSYPTAWDRVFAE